MNYEEICEKLEKLPRDKYFEVYKFLGSKMFSNCYIPNVADFANAYGEHNDKSDEAMNRIKQVTNFTGKQDDIDKSLTRKDDLYTEEESRKFMNDVISANITSIKDSGYLYKKATSSTDSMTITDTEDCGSVGVEYVLPIDEITFLYKVRNHFIPELNEYIEDYKDFLDKTVNMSIIHVRTYLTCEEDVENHQHFCKKCAGLYRRSHDTSFVPKNIGLFSCLMVCEKATQASLDSMNKGAKAPFNLILEKKLPKCSTYEDTITQINKVIDEIGWDEEIESRHYEIILLSRLRKSPRKWYFRPLETSMTDYSDLFGVWIYRPNKNTLENLLDAEEFETTSMKSKIALGKYNKM